MHNADDKSMAEILTVIAANQQAMSSGTEFYSTRRDLILQWVPALVAEYLDEFFSFLGAGLGLGIPLLGIRPFPQGSCTIIPYHRPPKSKATTKGLTTSEFMVEPDYDGCDYMAPLLLTIDQVQVSTLVPQMGPQPQQVWFAKISLVVRLAGADLEQVQRLSDAVQKYIADPGLFEGGDMMDKSLNSSTRSLTGTFATPRETAATLDLSVSGGRGREKVELKRGNSKEAVAERPVAG